MSPSSSTARTRRQSAYDYHFSIRKARTLLGYEPQVPWREGLRRTVEAYRAGR